jgi:hypothetical protein
MRNLPRKTTQPSTNKLGAKKVPLKPATKPQPEKSLAKAPVVSPILPKARSPKNALLVMAALLSGIGLISGGIWLSVQLIFDPDSILWLNQFLPEWTQIPIASRRSPQTLSDIYSSLEKHGLAAGNIVSLSSKPDNGKMSDFLLPVVAQQPNCNASPALCQQIVELRVYQPTAPPRRRHNKRDTYFQMVNQSLVAGPEESFAIAPLVGANVANLGNDQPLPLTQIQRFTGELPKAGIWLYLSGRRSRGTTPITYGQIAHYNPKRGYLSLMQHWASPTTQVPYWREVTGGGSPELVVDQTVGLEPRFRIYQVKPHNFLPDPIQLEEITLTEPTIDDPTYNKALLLAKNGLWSTAEQWLRSLKHRTKQWSNQTQAQLDLIHWHARITHAQAEKSWSNPSQQVLTNLIDGRWAKALKIFESSSDRSEVIAFLKTESSRLWSRANAALKVDPAQLEVKAWGALILSAQKGKPAAIAWLRKQPKNTAKTNQRILALLNQLDRPTPVSDGSLTSHPSRIVGSAQPLSQVNAQTWLRLAPQTPLKLEPEQMWYQIQLATFHDGNSWQKSTGLSATKSSLTKLQGKLGLYPETPIQLIFWLPDGQQETINATVQAVRSQGNSLQLLAMGDRISSDVPRPGSAVANALPRPLAFTEAALQWAEPTSITLMDLFEQSPEQTNAILASLQGVLRQAGLNLEATPTSAETLQTQGIADWTVQLLDFNEDQQPEVVLPIDLPALVQGKPAALATHDLQMLIFAGDGKLLYSNLDRSQQVIAIVNLEESQPALLVHIANNYRLLRWSTKNRRFE